jgi:hypothetical protein
VHKTKIANWDKRNNLDPVSANTFPCPNINVEKTARWQNFKSIPDNIFKHWESACTPFW